MFAAIFAQKLPDGLTLADFAYTFSPLVEETAPDTMVIDVEGCELLFGSAYELASDVVRAAVKRREAGGLGCKVNVALAANPDAAIHAARFFKGITFISAGEELSALGELPIENLLSPKFPVQSPKSKVQSPKFRTRNSSLNKETLDIGHGTLDENEKHEILETLRLWGIRTFRDFAALPITGVSERLGQEGVRLQQLASGKSERYLKLKQAAPVFANSVEVEHPITEREPLSFILARLLNQLCASLNAYALATNELRVQMGLEDGTIHERMLSLPSPMRDHKVFLKLLLLDTEMHPPESAVVSVSITCEPVKPRLLQNGLFIPLTPEPEKLELTLARLGKLVGPANVGSPALIDTHRPDTFMVKKFLVNTAQEKKRDGRGAAEKWRHGDRVIGRDGTGRGRQDDKDFGGKLAMPPAQDLRVPNKPRALPILAFRVFRPPLRAMVEASRGYPTQLSAWGANRSVYGKIVRLGGPWRRTGDWWLESHWARDEWDVTVESGLGVSTADGQTGTSSSVLYRIYRELQNGWWFVEGIYD